MSLCACGCGRATPIATHTRTADGIVRGQPTRYALGHNGGAKVPPKKNLRGTPEQRFWAKVDKGDGTGCWRWMSTTITGGYGSFGATPGRKIGAHRFSWMLHFGPIPDGMLVCHHCDNPECTRPDHLFLGTVRDNALDAKAKGRLRNKRRFIQRCCRGHEFTPENTRIAPPDRHGCRARVCKACQKINSRTSYLARKAAR